MPVPRTLSSPAQDHPAQARDVSLVIWQRPIRIIHWGLACVVLANLLWTVPTGMAHAVLGYVAILLVLARLVWGLFGHGYTHLCSYRCAGLGQQIADLLRGVPHAYIGHSPLSCLFALSVWGGLFAVSCRGILTTLDLGGRFVASAHTGFATVILVLVALHLSQLLAARMRRRPRSRHSMITGRQSLSRELDIRA